MRNNMSKSLNYKELHGVRKALTLVPHVKAGAYSLRTRDSFCEDLGSESLTPPMKWLSRLHAQGALYPARRMVSPCA